MRTSALSQLVSIIYSNRKNLPKSDLSYWGIESLDLWDGNLSEADLSHVRWIRGKLGRSNLQGARLDYASFEGTTFAGADLRGISAQGVNFTDCDMSDCHLEGVRLDNSTLVRVCFNQAQLAGASFEGSSLVDADFGGSFRGDELNFAHTNLQGVKGLTNVEKTRAFAQGAVEMSDDDFFYWRENNFQRDAAGKPQL